MQRETEKKRVRLRKLSKLAEKENKEFGSRGVPEAKKEKDRWLPIWSCIGLSKRREMVANPSF